MVLLGSQVGGFRWVNRVKTKRQKVHSTQITVTDRQSLALIDASLDAAYLGWRWLDADLALQLACWLPGLPSCLGAALSDTSHSAQYAWFNY
jgi:hypothetical protein